MRGDEQPSEATNETLVSRAYFLIIEAASSRLERLPLQGQITIGSDVAATVRLRDRDVLPEHLRLDLEGDEPCIVTCAEGASAKLNSELFFGGRVLASGDTVELGTTQLVFHREAGSHDRRDIESVLQLRRRIVDEIRRCERTERPFALLALHLGEAPHRIERELLRLVSDSVRLVDTVSWDGGAEILVLLPETAASVRVPAERLMEALRIHAPALRAGVAIYPSDGRNVDALLAGARHAARAAAPGELVAMAESAGTLTLDDQTVYLADPQIRSLFSLVRRLAVSDLPVLVTGETGVGKELVARALHRWSKRGGARLVAINCAAVSETLLESELFGHERGAFTGADRAREGLLEAATGGTVFLDELGEIPLRAQATLLRAIETKRVIRVGSVKERPIDVRFVAATNRDLGREVADGRFRRDLFFRLGAARVVVPPLRDRPLDLPVLARMLLEEACAELGRGAMIVSPAAMQRLSSHSWPGNVRELKNLMDYCAATIPEPILDAAHLGDKFGPSIPGRLPRSGRVAVAAESAPPVSVAKDPARGPLRNVYDEIRELEKARITQALSECGGVRVEAARRIAMPLRTLVTKMKAYGIRFPVSARRRKVLGEA